MEHTAYIKKPSWLRKKINLKDCRDVKALLGGLNLNTVCQAAMCPNISECFSKNIATFLILGKICTRGCRFCNIEKGTVTPPDPGEPDRVAEAVKRLGLKHVVITSVTRDDLADGGSSMFSLTLKKVKALGPDIKTEVLVPDFKGDEKAISSVLNARPDIFAHNVETVPSLYPDIRRGASYQRSLGVIKYAKGSGKVLTKSGVMLGLGETEGEVISVMKDLRWAGCDLLSIGQYLSPSRKHYPVKEFIAPEMFNSYRTRAIEMGFRYVESGPYVRSSYMASNYI